MNNIDENIVAGFGDEWTRYDQSGLSREELGEIFYFYFSIFPWEKLPKNAVGFDLGCGSGRWASFVAPRVSVLHCIDPSPEALEVAKNNLRKYSNCRFHLAKAENVPLPDGSSDFCYSLGVLHHVQDTATALKACVAKLKPGGILLLYLYYAFDNRPRWFRRIWRLSDLLRRVITRMPYSLRYGFSKLIAFLVYFPLARCALLMGKLGARVDSFPLSYYRYRSFYVMCNDALDRFGTRLEQRFSREQIRCMMREAGLENIEFSETAPYWCAVGSKVCAE